MNFKLSEEQRLLKGSVDRFVAEEDPTADHWPSFAEFGWLGIGAPEEMGGIGGPEETMIVMEAFGRGLVRSPYVTGVVLAGALLGRAGMREQLESLAEGTMRYAVAFEESEFVYDPASVTTQAERRGSDFVLTGRKTRVIGADVAQTLIVSAASAGGIGLFCVPAAAKGVTQRAYTAEDGRSVSTVELQQARADAAIGNPGEGLELLEFALDHAVSALCSEAVGIMGVLHDVTLAYLKQRIQFGVPIGSFQALQHRMAEMFTELELARSMAFVATAALQEAEAGERARRVSAAKVQIARSGRFVGQNAIQLHGAIAMTDEYKIGHYFKRMTTIERLFGSMDDHLARYMSAATAGSRERALQSV